MEGENYYVLKGLRTTDIKVDVIYIDPPYNTGNEFIYNDKFKENKEEFKENYSNKIVTKDDKHKHSKWLSFMKQRLEIAKDLLKDDGIIFISIDDNEQAYLKVLMDEIFGENNFLANIVWQSKPSAGTDNKFVSNLIEYIIVYTKNKDFFKINKIKKDYKNDKSFNLEDKHLKIRGKYKLQKIEDSGLTYSKKLDYVITDNNGNKYYPGGFEKWKQRQNNGVKVLKEFQWRWSKEKVEWGIKNDFIVFKNNNVYRKNYQFVDNNLNKKEDLFCFQNLILSSKSKAINNNLNIGFSTSLGTTELRKIFENEKVFDHPKPSSLIKHLINFYPNKNTLILDFFAGSGTTGQAVMELNQEDDGNRRFILVTNNENNICEKITYERLYRVINGKGSNGEKIDWKYSEDLTSLKNNSLRYLTIDLIDKFDGQYEDIENKKELYKMEFNKDISIKDFNKE